MSRYAKDDANVILVGNKIDGDREVSTEKGEALASDKNYPFAETSAKTGCVSLLHCLSKQLEKQRDAWMKNEFRVLMESALYSNRRRRGGDVH